MTTNIKLLSDKAKVPTRGSDYAAGYDLYAAESVTIAPHTTMKVSTDIAIELPDGTFGGIFPRSGLATKRGLRCANCVGK
jgi:dUTP pyrophosphatase